MMMRLQDHSIAKNLTIGLFIVFGLVTSLALYASLRVSSRQANVELEEKAEEYITSLAEILAVPLWHFNEQVIKAIGTSYVHNDFIAALQIQSQVGNWNFTRDEPDTTPVFSRTRPLTYNGERLGEVTISMTSRYYTLLNRRFFWSYTSTLFFMVVILSLLSGGLLRQTVQAVYQSGECVCFR